MIDLSNINRHLKQVDFLLGTFDNASDDLTIGELKSELKSNFPSKFNTLEPLLNNYFGIYRLLPLILMKEIMKETYKNPNAELSGDIEKIKVIRNAVVHNDFSMDEQGYTFKDNNGDVSLKYSEYPEFIHRVENQFYNDNPG
jgi:hypothetical protein